MCRGPGLELPPIGDFSTRASPPNSSYAREIPARRDMRRQCVRGLVPRDSRGPGSVPLFLKKLTQSVIRAAHFATLCAQILLPCPSRSLKRYSEFAGPLAARAAFFMAPASAPSGISQSRTVQPVGGASVPRAGDMALRTALRHIIHEMECCTQQYGERSRQTDATPAAATVPHRVAQSECNDPIRLQLQHQLRCRRRQLTDLIRSTTTHIILLSIATTINR